MSTRWSLGVRVFVALVTLPTLFPPPSAAAAETAEAIARARQRFSLGLAGGRAFAYFARGDGGAWDTYLKDLRPPPVSAERRARSLAMVRARDLVTPSAAQKEKLEALRPVLSYLERDSVAEVKLLRLDLAWTASLEGAAVLITPPALDLLAPAELEAVTAHELAHEYFAQEYEEARSARDYDTVREIELRCDAVAIVTMKRLGLDSGALLTGLAKLIKFNERHGAPNSRDLSPSWEERANFGRAMADLVESSGGARMTTLQANRH